MTGLRNIADTALFTVSRPNGITYFDKNGVLQQGGADEMVLDHTYDPGSGLWVPRGEPVFPGRTNLALHSNKFDEAVWNKVGGTVAQNALGIDGDTSAWTLEATSTSCRVEQAFTVANSTLHVFNVIARPGTQPFLFLSPVLFTTPGNGSTWFDLENGTIGNIATGHAAFVQEIAEGKFRCSIAFTTDSSDTTGVVRIAVSKAINQTICDVGDNIIIEHAQFQAGGYPGPIILGGGSSVTRAADQILIPSLDSWWTSDEGTWFAEFEMVPNPAANSARYVFSLGQQGSGSYYQPNVALRDLSVRADTDTRNGNLPQSRALDSVSGLYGVRGYGYGYSQDGMRTSFDGEPISSETTGPVFVPFSEGLSALAIGSNVQNFASPLGGWIRRVSFVPRKVSDSEILTRAAS